MNVHFCATLSFAVVVLAFSSLSYSQDRARGDGRDEAGDSQTLSEIVVVGARRRETVAIETGASLQVLDGELLREMSILDVEQLTFYAPGTSVNGGQVGFLSIRGVGNDSFSAGTEGSSAFFVDGVYRPRITSVLTDVVDVASAEVLRGPQGTQFGRNSLGGAINLITRRPTQEFEAEVDAWAGSYDLFRLQGGLSGPLGGSGVSGRLYGMKETRDGFIDNVSPVGRAPKTLDDRDLSTLRGALDFQLGDSVSLLLNADWLQSRDTGRVQPITGGDLRLLNQGAIISYDNIRETAIDVEPFQNIDDWGVSAKFEFELDGWAGAKSLTSLTSFREFGNIFRLDGDLTQLPASTLVFDLDSKYSQQEFLLSFDTGEAWEGVVGIFYFHEEADFVFDIGAPFIANTPPENVSVFQTEEVETDAAAIFTDWTWALSQRFSFNFGARYNWEEKTHSTRVRVGLINPPILFNDTGPLPAKGSWNDLTPKVGFEFTPVEGQLFYALVSKGFTAGNFSIGQQDPVDPESAWNYEIGHKGQFFDERLQTSLSLFWMELDDLQVELIGENEFDVTTPITANVGEARNRGGELEIRALPAPWFSFSTAITYLDAEFLRGSAVVEIPGGFQELTLDGNRQTQSPEWSVSTGLEFNFGGDFLGTGGSAVLRIEHQYVDEQFAGGNNLGVLNRDVDIIDSVNLVNARISYLFPDDRWSVSFVGKNLTDELVIMRLTGTEADYLVQPPDMVAQSKLPGDPRTWALVLGYRF